MKINTILKVMIIFLLGFISASLIGYGYGLEMPVLKDFGLSGSVHNSAAPSDFIKENQIEIYDDRIIIYVKDASMSRYASTGSMIPVLNENSNGIRIIPKSEEDINLGDIITFERGNELIVHRVVEKGSDETGVYFITRGDNNSVNDEKIRFKDIKYKTIAIVY